MSHAGREPFEGIAADVWQGLVREEVKRLPPRLFYDEAGSRLFEQITELPEYYPTRTERGIFEAHADEIAASAAAGSSHPIHVIELGAGTATKSQILLRALVRRQGRTLYLPVDVSAASLEVARARLALEEPAIEVRPLALRHEEVLEEVRRLGPRGLVLFIGSSIGNFHDDELARLLRGVRDSLGPGGALLVGADRKKELALLLPAYDDAQGITAAFNKNVLARINRELGGHFDLNAFAHRVRWDEGSSAVEMHLESLAPQRVSIEALGATVEFARGETIHTESSIKYDEAHLDRVLGAAGFVREQDFYDPQRWFGVHLCRVR